MMKRSFHSDVAVNESGSEQRGLGFERKLERNYLLCSVQGREF